MARAEGGAAGRRGGAAHQQRRLQLPELVGRVEGEVHAPHALAAPAHERHDHQGRHLVRGAREDVLGRLAGGLHILAAVWGGVGRQASMVMTLSCHTGR
jgi:hypothetical protein